jgi:hypothetical protein
MQRILRRQGDQGQAQRLISERAGLVADEACVGSAAVARRRDFPGFVGPLPVKAIADAVFVVLPPLEYQHFELRYQHCSHGWFDPDDEIGVTRRKIGGKADASLKNEREAVGYQIFDYGRNVPADKILRPRLLQRRDAFPEETELLLRLPLAQ